MSVVGPEERRRIAVAVEKARASPVPLAWVMANAIPAGAGRVALEDRREGMSRPPAQAVDLPGGYRANVSFEEQPSGLVRHLSVSLDEGTRAPAPGDFEAIREAFGFVAGGTEPARVWIEEFEPGRNAVHVIGLDRESPKA